MDTVENSSMLKMDPSGLLHHKILVLRNIFGLNANVKNNIAFLDESNVVYIAGRTIVFHNTTNGSQSFITGQERGEKSLGITAMCLTPNRKYIAVAEKGEDTPVILIYDTTTHKRRKTLVYPDAGSLEYVCLHFSQDSKYLAALSGYPDYKLVLWLMEGKSKVISVAETTTPAKDPVYQCSIGNDSKTICVTGNGIFKLYKFDSDSMKLIAQGLGKNESEPYLAHAWLDKDRIVVSNLNGDLYLVENGEFKVMLSSSPSNGLSINTIIPYGKGFICGGENGIATIFENDDREYYKKTKTLKLDGNEHGDTTEKKILNFALSPSSEFLAVTTADSQIYTLNLSSSDILKEDEIKFEYLWVPFHSKEIVGVDTCIRKPLIVTCGKDKTLRIWNYMDNSVNIIKHFNVEATSVSMHPTGLFLVVGFIDKLRFMNILGSDIREHKTFMVRNSPETKFSKGGQYFAAIHGNVINIYNTYTCQNIRSLRAHSSKVTCVHWNDEDTKLASAGLDGAVYEFIVQKEKRISENINRLCNYTSVVSDGTDLIAVGNDKMLRKFKDSQVTSELKLGKCSARHLCYGINQKLLFAGMEDGSIRIYHDFDKLLEQQFVHSGAITGMCLTYDEGLLFTVSEDGCLSIFEVRDKEGSKIKREIKMAEEILISYVDLAEKNTRISDLEAQVAELRSDNEYEQRKKDLEYNEKLKEQANAFKLEMKKKTDKVVQLMNEKEQIRREFDQKIFDLENEHKQVIAKIENDYNQKIAGAMDQLKQKETQKLETEKELLNRLKLKEEEHERKITHLKDEHEEKIKKLKDEILELQKSYENEKKRYEEIIHQLKDEREKEIDELKDEYERKLKEDSELIMKLRGEATIARNQRATAEKHLEEKEKAIKEYNEQIEKFKIQEKGYIRDINSLKKENKEREDTIVNKEKRIFDLKKQNQELEKFKFVLDYKITTLTDQIKPSKDRIESLRKELSKMDQELEKFKKNNNNLLLTKADMKLKLDAQAKEIARIRNLLKDAEVFKSRVRTDIHEIVQYIQDPKLLKEGVRQLHEKYVTQKVKRQEVQYDIQKEYDRQRTYLEKTIESLKKKLVKSSETAKQDNMRIMHENVLLINEINQLRREVRILRNRCNMMEISANAGRRDDNGQLTREELLRDIEMQRIEIQKLRDKLQEYERGKSRPISREKLPRMEGFTD